MTLFLFAAGWGQALACVLMFLISLFLILLVLVQRGRGGGLSGAFGGMGGQSAFGTKAGDTFTKITIVASTIWILVCMVACKFLGNTDPNATILTEQTSVLQPTVPGLENESSLNLQRDAALDEAASESSGETDSAEVGALLDAAVDGAPGEESAEVAAEFDTSENEPD